MHKTTNAKHYTAHAIESIRKHAATLVKNGDKSSAADLLRIVEWLEQAVVFALPDGGRLLDNMKPLSVNDTDILRLPYPVVALEYHIGDVERGDTLGSVKQTIDAPRRIALCIDFSADQAKQVCPVLAAKSDFADSVGHDGGILVIGIWEANIEHLEGWFPAAVGAVISRKQDAMAKPTIPAGLGIDESDVTSVTENPVAFSMEPIVPLISGVAMMQLGREKAMAEAYADLIDELNAASSFIQAMACTNIVSEKVPATPKLNKKRIKNGKIPYSDYHVLKIRLSGSKTENNSGADHDRRTPREHLRRGHIRRLSNGRRTWVNPCIVAAGSEGKAHKSYRVAP